LNYQGTAAAQGTVSAAAPSVFSLDSSGKGQAVIQRIALDPSVVVYQQRQGLALGLALRERFVWSRSFAATRAGLAQAQQRLVWSVFAPALPLLMLARMTVMVSKKRRAFGAFLRAFPLAAALIMSWSWGQLIGYLTGKANAQGAQAAETISRGQAQA
jgi:hypothetical protein